MLEKLKEIESLGGEGLMLRKPGSYVPLLIVFCGILIVFAFHFGRTYEGRRSGSLLKIKVRVALSYASLFFLLFRSRLSMMPRLSLLVMLQVKDATKVALAL